MAERPVGSIIEHFSDMDDPRRENKRHLLLDIIVIAVCGVICGADDWGAGKMSSTTLLLLPMLLPLLGTIGIIATRRNPNLRESVTLTTASCQGRSVTGDGESAAYTNGAISSATVASQRAVMGVLRGSGAGSPATCSDTSCLPGRQPHRGRP